LASTDCVPAEQTYQIIDTFAGDSKKLFFVSQRLIKTLPERTGLKNAIDIQIYTICYSVLLHFYLCCLAALPVYQSTCYAINDDKGGGATG
jgi:hypothetical protein